MIPLETISLSLSKRVNPKETDFSLVMKIAIGYKNIFSQTRLRITLEILDNSWTRSTGLKGSRDARDKIFKAFEVFKGACYPSRVLVRMYEYVRARHEISHGNLSRRYKKLFQNSSLYLF